jgi:hypothetical protein
MGILTGTTAAVGVAESSSDVKVEVGASGFDNVEAVVLVMVKAREFSVRYWNPLGVGRVLGASEVMVLASPGSRVVVVVGKMVESLGSNGLVVDVEIVPVSVGVVVTVTVSVGPVGPSVVVGGTPVSVGLVVGPSVTVGPEVSVGPVGPSVVVVGPSVPMTVSVGLGSDVSVRELRMLLRTLLISKPVDVAVSVSGGGVVTGSVGVGVGVSAGVSVGEAIRVTVSVFVGASVSVLVIGSRIELRSEERGSPPAVVVGSAVVVGTVVGSVVPVGVVEGSVVVGMTVVFDVDGSSDPVGEPVELGTVVGGVSVGVDVGVVSVGVDVGVVAVVVGVGLLVKDKGSSNPTAWTSAINASSLGKM